MGKKKLWSENKETTIRGTQKRKKIYIKKNRNYLYLI